VQTRKSKGLGAADKTANHAVLYLRNTWAPEKGRSVLLNTAKLISINEHFFQCDKRVLKCHVMVMIRTKISPSANPGDPTNPGLEKLFLSISSGLRTFQCPSSFLLLVRAMWSVVTSSTAVTSDFSTRQLLVLCKRSQNFSRRIRSPHSPST
jgi:hypothetical protein